MAPPKFVSVLWIESGQVSTISSKYVINKDMLYNFDLVGLVQYPDGKSNPLPQLQACVYQAGGKFILNVYHHTNTVFSLSVSFR